MYFFTVGFLMYIGKSSKIKICKSFELYVVYEHSQKLEFTKTNLLLIFIQK